MSTEISLEQIIELLKIEIAMNFNPTARSLSPPPHVLINYTNNSEILRRICSQTCFFDTIQSSSVLVDLVKIVLSHILSNIFSASNIYVIPVKLCNQSDWIVYGNSRLPGLLLEFCNWIKCFLSLDWIVANINRPGDNWPLHNVGPCIVNKDCTTDLNRLQDSITTH